MAKVDTIKIRIEQTKDSLMVITEGVLLLEEGDDEIGEGRKFRDLIARNIYTKEQIENLRK